MVGCENHCLVTGLDRIEVVQPPHRRGKHDTGEIVALENIGALQGSGGDDKILDPSQHQPLLDMGHVTLHHRDPVVVIATGHHCISHHLDSGLSLDGCSQVGQSLAITVIPETEMTAKGGLLLYEDHRCSRFGCCNGRSHACGTATGHQDVGVGVAVVVLS